MQFLNYIPNLILVCLGLHLFADFILQIQGHLDKLKQRSWWDQQISGKAERLKELRETILYGITQVPDNVKRIDLAKKFVDFVNLADTEVGHNSSKYRYDYLCALLCHSLLWSIVTFIPLMIVKPDSEVIPVVILTNAIVHSIVDHFKCNTMHINLCADQLIHLVQVVGTVYICFTFFH